MAGQKSQGINTSLCLFSLIYLAFYSPQAMINRSGYGNTLISLTLERQNAETQEWLSITNLIMDNLLASSPSNYFYIPVSIFCISPLEKGKEITCIPIFASLSAFRATQTKTICP